MADAFTTMLLAIAGLAATPVPDAELAQMRGGFRLPGGIELALTVRSDTSIDGALLLRSVFSVVGDTPVLQVLAPPKGSEPPASTPGGATSAASLGPVTAQGIAAGGNAEGAVSVRFDRQNGATIVPAVAVSPSISVTSGTVAAAGDAAAAGLEVVPVVSGGGAIETAGGQVSVAALPEGMRVRLAGAGIDVSHLVGAAFGSVIANTANDRTIDTTTTVSVELGNARPEMLGSAMFQVENLAVAAARLGVR